MRTSRTLHSDQGQTRSNRVTEMLQTRVRACVIAVFLIITVTGWERQSGGAVVLSKEHIDAALPISEIPNAQSEPSPNAEIRPMADDEIDVEGYVMKPEVRGTSRHPRGLKDE